MSMLCGDVLAAQRLLPGLPPTGICGRRVEEGWRGTPRDVSGSNAMCFSDLPDLPERTETGELLSPSSHAVRDGRISALLVSVLPGGDAPADNARETGESSGESKRGDAVMETGEGGGLSGRLPFRGDGVGSWRLGVGRATCRFQRLLVAVVDLGVCPPQLISGVDGGLAEASVRGSLRSRVRVGWAFWRGWNHLLVGVEGLGLVGVEGWEDHEGAQLAVLELPAEEGWDGVRAGPCSGEGRAELVEKTVGSEHSEMSMGSCTSPMSKPLGGR
mmetsp:Transcript_51998/g.126892  ORF Transcript_51998/g.126892 Transcript_51998/m.126892 type:complete len:273 (-) Transcript_51998:255-1073(-)